MRLVHATPKRNVKGILARGILPAYALGRSRFDYDGKFPEEVYLTAISSLSDLAGGVGASEWGSCLISLYQPWVHQHASQFKVHTMLSSGILLELKNEGIGETEELGLKEVGAERYLIDFNKRLVRDQVISLAPIPREALEFIIFMSPNLKEFRQIKI